MELIVDLELRDWLSRDCIPEKCTELLEKDLLENGIRDKIVVWRKRNLILDGHRRYEIAKKHNLPFEVHYLDFETFPECKAWMEMNQNERRNHDSGTVKQYLAELFKSRVKAGVKREKALEEVAAQTGVSTQTVRRANRHSDALDSLPKKVADKLKDVRVTTRDIQDLSELPEEHQLNVVQQFEDGEFKTLGQALRGEGEKDSAKDREKRFAEAIKNLGVFAKSLDYLKDDGEKQYSECRKHVSDLGEILRKWR